MDGIEEIEDAITKMVEDDELSEKKVECVCGHTYNASDTKDDECPQCGKKMAKQAEMKDDEYDDKDKMKKLRDKKKKGKRLSPEEAVESYKRHRDVVCRALRDVLVKVGSLKEGATPTGTEMLEAASVFCDDEDVVVERKPKAKKGHSPDKEYGDDASLDKEKDKLKKSGNYGDKEKKDG